MALAPVSVAIVGDDRNVQRTFARVERRAAQVASSGERFSSGLQRLGDAGGVTKLAGSFQEVGRRIKGAAESMGRFAPALAGLTSIASVAGLARLVENWTTFGSKLGLDAQRIGMASQNLHGLQGAARLAGSSAEALTSGMMALGDNLVDAVGGRSPMTIQMLSQLGIAFQDVGGHARTAEAVLPEVADRIAALRNPALQARAAVALFGGAGEALLPFLRRGAAGIADYNAEARRYGVLNEDGVRAANSLREAQTRLGLAVEGVGYSIAERVAPVLVPLLKEFADWISDNRGPITDFFGEIADGLKRWAGTGGPQRLLAALKEVGKEAIGVLDRLLKLIERLGISPGRAAEIGIAGWLASRFLPGGGVGALAGIARLVARNPLVAAATLSGDTPDGGSGRRFTPEEMAGGEQNNQRTNDRFGYNGNFWHDTWRFIRSGGHPQPDAPRLSPNALSAGQVSSGQRAYDFWRAQGLDHDSALIMTSDMIRESGGNPGARGDGGDAHGLYQHHAARRDAIQARTGINMSTADFDDQLRGTWAEMNLGLDGRARQALDVLLDPRSTHDQRNRASVADFERSANQAADIATNQAIMDRLNPQIRRPPTERYGFPMHDDPSTWPAAPPSPPAAPVSPVPAPIAGAGANGSNGSTTVRLEHVNPPDGTKVSVQTSGDVTYGGLRIERPLIGSAP